MGERASLRTLPPSRVRPLLVAVLALMASAFSWWTPLGLAAQPQITSLFPSGVPIGSSVEIEAKGKLDKWPIQVWVDRPGLTFQLAADKGKLTAAAAADAEPSVYWLRLYDAQGTTSPLPFVVGRTPEVVEQEPNDQPGKVQEIALPSVIVNGRLARRGDVDTFAVKLARGQTLVAEIDANRTLESPVDCLLEVVSTAGFVQSRNDDHQGLDPRIVFVAPEHGTYLVRTFGFPATPDSTIGLAGGEGYTYRLLLTVEGFVDYCSPLAIAAVGDRVEVVGWNIPEAAKLLSPIATADATYAAVVAPHLVNRLLVPIERHPSITTLSPSDPQQPQHISLPITVTGRISAARESNSFRFSAEAGSTLLFRIESRDLGFPLDPVMELFDAMGKSLLRVDDSTGGRDAELVYAVPAAGEYRLTVSDLHRDGGPRFVYRLRATLAQPDYVLSLAADSFAVAAGSPLEIPVKIERLHGFTQPITIRAEGLAEGLQAEPVISPAEGDLSKEVKVIIKAGDKPFAGPIQVIGQVSGAENLTRRASSPIAGRIAKTKQPWLTVTVPAAP